MLETGKNIKKTAIEILNIAEFKWNFNRKTTRFMQILHIQIMQTWHYKCKYKT